MKIKAHKIEDMPKEYLPYRQVVYVESYYNAYWNELIQKEYPYLKTLFNNKGLDFVYLPLEISKIKENPLFPIYKDPYLMLEFNSEFLLYLSEETPNEIGPSFVFSLDKERNSNSSVMFSIPLGNKHSYQSMFIAIRNMIACQYPNIGGTYYRRNVPRPYVYGKGVPSEAQNEVDDFVDKMKRKRITREELLKMINKSYSRDSYISHVIITKGYRIILDDVKGKPEAKMRDLTKALYLFFLKHQEGLRKDELYKFFPELTYIYISIKEKWNKGDTGKTLSHINALIMGQFANKCSEIRKSFDNAVNDRISYSINSREEVDDGTFLVNIPDSKLIWQCPNILNNHIPQIKDGNIHVQEKTRKILDNYISDSLKIYL